MLNFVVFTLQTVSPLKSEEEVTMKKLILVTAIAAACAAPMAAMSDTTIYGQLRYSFNSVNEDGVATGSDIDGLRGEDNVSLFGVKGSYGEDIKAFFHLQTGAPADVNTGSNSAFKQRFYFGGLSGGFGKVAYGRMTNAYKFPGFKLDPFYNWSHIGAGGSFGSGGATYGLSPATNGFTDNALQYTTPSMGGFKLLGGVYIDDSNEDDGGYTLGGVYTGDAFNVGVVYGASGEDATKDSGLLPGIAADEDALRVYGGYNGDRWSIAASYENVDLTADLDADYLYVPVQWKATDKIRLALAPGWVSDGPAEGWGLTAGAFWTVAKHADLVLSGSYADRDDGAAPYTVTVGAIHKF